MSRFAYFGAVALLVCAVGGCAPEDTGTRLLRECESIMKAAGWQPGSTNMVGATFESQVRHCIQERGLAGK